MWRFMRRGRGWIIIRGEMDGNGGQDHIPTFPGSQDESWNLATDVRSWRCLDLDYRPYS